MAFIDQRVGRNQRVAVITVAAVLQGAVIVALIHGFTVQWRLAPAPERTEAEQIKLEPIPTPIPPPPPERQIERKVLTDPLPPHPAPPIGPIFDPLPPIPAGPVDTPYIAPVPPPQPVPSFTPRAPKPKNAPGTWATSNDYPARNLREGNQGVTGFALTVGTDGRVQSCAITRSSGFPGLDKATCDNVSRRARFEPATDGSGARIAGTYSSNIRWQIPQD